MLARFGQRLDRVFQRITPDPFVVAVLLSGVVLTAGWAWTGSVLTVIDAWQARFWGLLSFGMQMCLVLVTGHALAVSPPMRRALRWLADRPQSGPAAAALVAAVSVALSLLNWGLCIVGGALLAREVGRSCRERAVAVHYPLIAACGYVGMMTWHGGFSGSAPLKMTTRPDLLELLGPGLGSSVEPVPLQDTLLSGLNLGASLGALVWIPLVMYMLAPQRDARPFDPALSPVAEEDDATRSWQDHPLITGVIVVPLVFAVVVVLQQRGIGRLDPNVVNLMLLTSGLALHGSVRRYARAAARATSGCSGIILQFPLYAGIMGVMTTTGMAEHLARSATESTSPRGFVLFTFLSAGLVNLFVPSGGGQWAVQGPIAVEAGASLGVPLGSVVMAVAYGDQWTNMLQPFWALPLLGITGVRAGEIIGYTFVVLLAGFVWFALCLLLLG